MQIRGFLVGPYCPIYGCGALINYIMSLTGVKRASSRAFSTAILVCGVLEYATSYIMEKLFHARWWDYSDCKFNINGEYALKPLFHLEFRGITNLYC